MDAVKKRLTELDGAEFLTEEGHLEIFLLMTWRDFQNRKKSFEKELVREVVKQSNAFVNFSEQMFVSVWNKVLHILKSVFEPKREPIACLGYEAYT